MNDFDSMITTLIKQVEEVATNTLQRSGELGVKTARETTLFHHGKSFEDAIKFYRMQGYEGEVISEKEYSQWLEYGNDPGGGIIRPKDTKVLHFVANGQDVFVKFVHAHEPLPFMEHAQEVVETEIANIWDEEFNKI